MNRKRSEIFPAKKVPGWTEIKESLDDFMIYPRIPSSQQDIESSSGDSSDEGGLCSKSKARCQTKQKALLAKSKLYAEFPEEMMDSGIKRKLKVVKCSSLKSSASNSKSILKYAEIPDGINAPTSGPSTLLIDYPEKDNTEPQKTPLKETEASPVIGSQRTKVVHETPPSLSSESESPARALYYRESVSPVFKSSQRTAFVAPTSPVLGVTSQVKGALSPVLESIDSKQDLQEPTSPLIGMSKERINRRAGRLRHRWKTALSPALGDSVSSLLGNDRNGATANLTQKKQPNTDCGVEEYSRAKLKDRNLYHELSQEYSKKFDVVKIEEHSSPIQASVDSVPIPSKAQALCEFGDDLHEGDLESEEIFSESDSSDIVETSEVEIEILESPIKDSQSNSAKLSEESGQVIVSVESVVSPKETTCTPKEKSSKLEDFLRRLQHRSPEKLACQPEFVESTRKRVRKDGYSGRLHRLINSWQSAIHIWIYETTIRSPTVRTPKLENSLRKFSPDDKSKVLPSPSVRRNLQNFMIESPQSSPGLPRPKRNVFVKKRLRLKVLQVGGKLLNNCGLCKGELECFGGSQNKTEDEVDCSGHLKQPVTYLVFFNFADHNAPPNLHVGDNVEVYSPWNILDLPLHKIPVLFTSFFKISKEINNKDFSVDVKVEQESMRKPSLKRKASPKLSKEFRKKIILFQGSCSCLTDSGMLPSMCEFGQHVAKVEVNYKSASDNIQMKPGFRVVKNASQELQQNDNQQTWTVLEAVKRAGGISDMHVTLLVRVHRIFVHSNSRHEVEGWEVLAQDANGLFCVVKIPNCPLVKELSNLIEEGEGLTWTITHVNIIERITDAQDPGLFSLISSLQHHYQEALKDDPCLLPLLKDHISSPAQTYCYIFSVNLGATKVLNGDQEVVIPISLPQFSFQELTEVTNDNRRGSVCFYILYRLGNFLYVVNQQEKFSKDGLQRDQLLESDSSQGSSSSKIGSKKDFFIKVSLSSKATLPRWIPTESAVKMHVIVRDVLIRRGSAIIDEYSSIQPEKSQSEISLLKLVKILKPLSPANCSGDLAVLSGTIHKIDEETASTWLSCSNCGSFDVKETSSGGNCLACAEHNVSLNTEYFMEVWLNCCPAIQNSDVKVKLDKTTVQKLLRYQESESGGYDSSSLLGRHLGCMVCLLEEVKKPKNNRHTYNLKQLPY